MSHSSSGIRRTLRWLLIGGFAGALFLLIWSALIEPRLIFEEYYDVAIPNLPPEWQNQRVALIADPQVGIWLSNVDTVRRIVAKLVKMRPAAVFIAGDFIYEPPPDRHAGPRELREQRAATREDIDKVVELLRPLTAANIPTFAVLGNHDHAGPNQPRQSELVRQALERLGIHVLSDRAVQLPSPQGSRLSDLWLVGLSSHAAQGDHSQAALAQLPADAPRLVLMHNPDSFADLPAGTAPLAMAGHTHGGQVKFPFLLLRRLLGRVESEPRPISGWIEDEGTAGNHLYVNRGIGFSRLPVRFNAPPEITVFTLRSGRSG